MPGTNITVTFEGNLSEQNWPAMERLVRLGLENPQVYVSRGVFGLAVVATVAAAAMRSPAVWVLALVTFVAWAAWARSPHGVASWRNEPDERRVQSGEIRAEGVLFVRDDGRWQLPWSTFTGYMLDAAGLVLYLPGSWIAIPRLSVRSTEEWLSAVNIVQAAVPARRMVNPFLDVAAILVFWLTLMGLILVMVLWLAGWWRV